MKSSHLLIFFTVLWQYAIAVPLLDGIIFPSKRVQQCWSKFSLQRNAKITVDFQEIRERIAKIVVNVTKYSGKVQNGISKMDIEKNKLSKESSEAVVKQKQLTDERHSLEQQLSTAKNDIALTNERLRQINSQITKEAQDVRNAENDLNHKRREKPRWHCVWRCRKKWKRAQRKRVENAERVLRAAQERHANAIKRKGEEDTKLNNLNLHKTNIESLLKKNAQEATQWKEKLLKSTHLTETVLQLLKDLSSLQLNVNHLKGELESRQDLDDEDLGVGWESINAPLKVISDYINNGGFVKDLAGWGIDIKGFDVESLRSLGIEIDEKTVKLLKMKP